jgi:hypothetical protein
MKIHTKKKNKKKRENRPVFIEKAEEVQTLSWEENRRPCFLFSQTQYYAYTTNK